MSTHAIVAIRLKNRKSIAIYCHHDGYPEHMIPTLTNNYKTKAQVMELIDLGDTSFLEPNIKLARKECYAYKRNYVPGYEHMKNDNVMPTSIECDRDLVKYADEQFAYLYVFDELDNRWFHYVNGKEVPCL